MKALLPEGGLVVTRYESGIKTSVHLGSITLRDGTRVEDPRDLLPAMEPGSAAPTYVAAYERAFTGWLVSSTVQQAMIVGGLAAIATAVFTSEPPGPPQGTFSARGIAAIGGLASVFVFSWIPFLISRVYQHKTEEERTGAFNAYPSSLSRRLDLEEPEAPVLPRSPVKPEQALLGAPLRLALLPR